MPEGSLLARQPRPVELADPLRGIALLILAMAACSCSDVAAKFLNRSLPPVEIAWLRYATFVALVLPSILVGGALRARRPGLQILRGIGMLGSAVFFIAAIRFLPLADATATAFVSPLFITALSIPFLKERVGIRRWSAVLLGLAGVLVIVRPGAAGFSPASLLPILSALSWALGIVITRLMRGTDSLGTTLAYTALTGFALLSLAAPASFVLPGPLELALGLFCGVMSAMGQWLVVLAYRHADASLLAPFSYTQLLWAAGLGFAVFGAVPGLQTAAGAAIIIAAGLYTAQRERARLKAA